MDLFEYTTWPWIMLALAGALGSDRGGHNLAVIQPSASDRERAHEWPNPTLEMLADPLFDLIWSAIKTWDIAVPDAYGGYCGATGNHARAIYDAVVAAARREGAEQMREAAAQCARDRSKWAEDKIRDADDDTFAGYSNACDDCAELISALPLPEPPHDP